MHTNTHTHTHTATSYSLNTPFPIPIPCVLCIVQPLGTVSVKEEVSQIIDDTFSHITAIANGSSSDRRDSPDGGETLPFPVLSSADHTSPTQVCGCGCLAWLGLVRVGLVYVCILLISSTQFVTGLV